MRSSARAPWPILFAALLAACAGVKAPPGQATGSAELEVLPPPPYEPLPEGVRPSFGPMVIPYKVKLREPPVYPEPVLSAGVSCTARILYHILEDGTVSLVRLDWDDPQPAEYEDRFEEEIRKAMREWRYIPAHKLVPTKLEDGSTTTVFQPIPKAERAVVRFRVEKGRGIVE